MEPKLILAFALGFILCKIFNILFLTKTLYGFIIQVHLETLFFLGLVAEDFAFTRTIKYSKLMASGKSVKEIENITKRDLEMEEKTKESIINVYKSAFPKDFNFIIKDITWDSALSELTKKIKNQRR